MLVRAAILMASLFVTGQALAQDTLSSTRTEIGVVAQQQPATEAEIGIAPPGFGLCTEDEEVSGAALHRSELNRIAVYASVGNRDGVEILSSQIRQFGVTRDELRSAIAWTKVHESIDTADQRETHIDFDKTTATRVSY